MNHTGVGGYKWRLVIAYDGTRYAGYCSLSSIKALSFASYYVNFDVLCFLSFFQSWVLLIIMFDFKLEFNS